MSTEIDKLYWRDFLAGLESGKADRFCLGRCTMTYTDLWHYAHLDCYALRIYSRALNDEEVLENYNMTISYHEFLEKENGSIISNY